ncbi:efflux RND transporter periplasmic adaptor subunit [Photobacterium sanctipauli]|uniref:Efflux RND transporter periplasmic adaptor subunit n=1 Tax=Photobacterium sanctipauli TaxID=1342794 RepID=A0A2T3NPM0_9GAMM|nr:efflux RND transporter periplasmic adaptor subunit [Photobacterium sanctipauli]PSW18224.1 efflux RND transporter periplasmic adaptor subunit [Photobacterium sanctipauli]
MASIKQALSKRPWIISLFILALLSLWLFSGYLPSAPSADEPAGQQAEAKPANITPPLAKVIVEQFTPQPVTRTISLYGRTAPDRQATLGAEVSGTVEKLLVRKGQRAKTGQPLLQLAKADRELQLLRAKALLKVRDQEFKAAQSLRKRGLQGEVALSQAEAALIEAKADVRSLQIALDNTVIYAPFDGIVETLHVEQGDYLGVGDPVASVVDLDPLVINADISERHIDKVYLNQPADINLVTGFSTQGELRYRASVASEQTNTYPIEIEIPNPDMTLTAGISADVELILETKPAIKVTPSMLALDEAGNLGIKTLAAQDTVAFHPISLVKVEPDGVWLGGFDSPVNIITVGQGFVRDGDNVEAVQQLGSE